jgi:hypothetical protein
MKNKTARLILLIAIGLLLAACNSTSDDVPSLAATPTAVVEDEIPDDEAAVMAFVQCMRDEGIELKDPVVDSDGNVQPPEVVEGVELTREEWAAPYEVCGHYIEGTSFGREREDTSARGDQFVKIANCLSEKGYDVDEPTAETIDQWGIDFRVEFDWDDPEAMEAYEECSSAGEGE